ncbi:MAG TPA: tRNA lysidine(34) synthetase TilS, partial [Phototrophicaceae bacterium]|nr:tRNA lysidine(34) synthetase TilS [Phototrophicaceae bacterium]
MLETVLHTLRQHDLIPAGTTLVVGVSGGADSLALLHLLHRLAPDLNCQLHAATFDHQLRGPASADDAQFVRQTAAAWGIPVTSGQGDVRERARRDGLSIEAAARAARYRFLAETARQVGAARVAVAHHADDQAETVLMHLIRGTGISGLSGMALQAPLPDAPDLLLIRPLLAVTRADIEAYCRDNDLHPRQDATNDDPTYLRNYLRQQTLPHLQTLNPQITRGLTQLADIAAVEDDYMQRQLQTMLHREAVIIDTENAPQPERIRLRREIFADLHPALQRRLVAWGAGQIAGSTQDIGYLHVVEAVALAGRGQLGAQALL